MTWSKARKSNQFHAQTMTNAVIIVAAGKGLRAAAAGAKPKQYLQLRGQPVLLHTLCAFLDQDNIDLVQTVIDPAHIDDYREIAQTLDALSA